MFFKTFTCISKKPSKTNFLCVYTEIGGINLLQSKIARKTGPQSVVPFGCPASGAVPMPSDPWRPPPPPPALTHCLSQCLWPAINPGKTPLLPLGGAHASLPSCLPMSYRLGGWGGVGTIIAGICDRHAAATTKTTHTNLNPFEISRNTAIKLQQHRALLQVWVEAIRGVH